MNMYIFSCHGLRWGLGGWVTAAVLRAEIDQNLSSKPSSGNCKFSIDSRVLK